MKEKTNKVFSQLQETTTINENILSQEGTNIEITNDKYKVLVNIYYRQTPSYDGAILGIFSIGTIVEIEGTTLDDRDNTWGKLVNEDKWINLKFTEKFN